MLDGAGQDAAGAAGGVQYRLAQLGVSHVHHELGDGAGRVVFARVAGVLEVAEDLLVDVAEQVPVVGAVEVDLVQRVDDLPHEGAGLHVVVGILEHGLDHEATGVGVGAEGQVLERAEQGVVDEVQQFIAGDALRVGRPGAPAELGRDGGLVAALHQLVLLLPVIEDLQE